MKIVGEWHSDGVELCRYFVIVIDAVFPEFDPAELFLYRENERGNWMFYGIRDSAFSFEVDLVARQLIRDAESCEAEELAEDFETWSE